MRITERSGHRNFLEGLSTTTQNRRVETRTGYHCNMKLESGFLYIDACGHMTRGAAVHVRRWRWETGCSV